MSAARGAVRAAPTASKAEAAYQPWLVACDDNGLPLSVAGAEHCALYALSADRWRLDLTSSHLVHFEGGNLAVTAWACRRLPMCYERALAWARQIGCGGDVKAARHALLRIERGDTIEVAP